MSREVRRVPRDFDWPLKETWGGYLNPYSSQAEGCASCGGRGWAPRARLFHDQWYGNAPFDPKEYGATPLTLEHPRLQAFARNHVERNKEYYIRHGWSIDAAVAREAARLLELWIGSWSHHLIQVDVDALIAAGRLMDFTRVPRTDEQRELVRKKLESGGNSWLPESNGYVPTADEVNAWSIGFGHDEINCSVCVTARCRREGSPVECAVCNGEGSVWPSPKIKKLHEEWEEVPPPEGHGFQMWETTSEGSPISPVFETPEELARWRADTGASAFGRSQATYEQWLVTCRGEWAPSAVMIDGKLMSGVEASALKASE